MPAPSKKHLRAWAKGCRAAIRARQARSEAICRRLLDLVDRGCPTAVGAYWASGSEAMLTPFLTELMRRGLPSYLPKVDQASRTMRYLAFEGEDRLAPGPYGLLEPSDRAPAMEPEEGLMVLVPGLLFTEAGARLGYGGGYYDRFLGDRSPEGIPTTRKGLQVVGVAFDDQIVSRLPEEAHDCRMDMVVTEERTYIRGDRYDDARRCAQRSLGLPAGR